MKKHNILLVLFFIIGLLCPVGAQEKKEILSNVFTLELSFGDKDLPDEYLLARPFSIDINNAGDVYVFDEQRIKVFTRNGKPKTILGGPGEGPTEFGNQPLNIYISPDGYISAFGTSLNNLLSILSPNNKFIVKRRYNSNELLTKIAPEYTNNGVIKEFYPYVLNDKEILSEVRIVVYPTSENKKCDVFDVLTYEKSGEMKVILKQENVNTAAAAVKGGGWGATGTSVLGFLSFSILPDNKIVYTHTAYDVRFEKDKAWYKLHIISLNNPEKTDFEIDYVPRKIPQSSIDSEKMMSSLGDEINRTIHTVLAERFEKAKYLPPFYYMTTDGYYLFTIENNRDDAQQIFVCIDLKTGKKVSTSLIPAEKRTREYKTPSGEKKTATDVIYFIGRGDIIKNGYLYTLKIGSDGYPIVEKYRIDPRVYGK